MDKREEPYYIGLDIGTSSVGWSVTNKNYELLNIKKKNLWGVRLFNEAETAAKRRTSRSTRRRYRRRRNRINWLNEIFSQELAKIDPSFLMRLNSSWVSKKDPSRSRDKYNLFIDKDYTDSDYYHDYRTIYHLRRDLMLNDKKFDIRLIYLALHNIIKYRGNFTYEYRKFNISEMNTDFTKMLIEFNQELPLETGFPAKTDFEKIAESLLAKDTSPTFKKDTVINSLTLDKDSKKYLQEILKLILGNSANLNNIFNTDLEKSDSKLSFSDKDIETKLLNLDSLLSDKQIHLITSANKIYSTITLNNILHGQTYLSLAKIEQYNGHRNDLSNLRKMWSNSTDSELIKQAQQAYKKYINSDLTADQLYKDITPFLENATPKNLAQEALKKINAHTYLLKQRTSENGVIPFQLNLIEMEKIIDNQSKYYPFLKENRDKLISILSFRIPYYVGPLQNDKKNPFAWMEKKVQKKARPWNFDEVVDREKSSNNFIKKMTSTDTYLVGEPVLPKNSLIYQRYEVLNELNNIRVTKDLKTDPKGSKLPLPAKQQIFNDLFKRYKKVTSEQLAKWLIANSYYTAPTIMGLAKGSEFISSLSTFIDLKSIFDQAFVEDSANQQQLEELIEWFTVFEDKKILSEKLNTSKYSYTPKQIKQLSNIRYRGWGRLSKKLLCGLKTETTTAQSHQSENYSILNLMWATKKNFNSILNDDNYKFKTIIDDYNSDKKDDVDIKELVDDIHTSPALKRSIIQSINIVQEIVKIMGHAPEHIFLEFTREDQTSSVTDSRKKQLKKLYASLSKDTKKIKTDLRKYLIPNKNIRDELRNHNKDLSNERLMLYFLQNGKSLYSGEQLEINKLSEYQVDHILPRTYIPDNSLENKALVLATENQRKADNLLLDPAIIDKNIERWTYMKDKGMMGPKKFKNLTRRVISDDDLNNFINRQLVQTSQIIKSVADILDNMYKDQGTTCIQSRANLTSSFRAAFSQQNDNYHFQHPEFIKNRDVNDFHHAQDAYLACLLGLYRLKKFPSDEMLLVKKEYRKFFAIAQNNFQKNGKMPDNQKNGFILTPMVAGDTVVDANKEEIWNMEFKNQVIKIFRYKQYNVTRRTEIKSGEFYNQTLYSPHDPKIKKIIAKKKDLDPTIYGGYSSANSAYLTIVKVDNKKTSLISVPIRLAALIDEGKLSLQKWLEDNVKHNNKIEILKTKIPISQLIHSTQSGYLTLQSEKEIANAQQLILPAEYVALLTLLHGPKTEYEQILSFYDEDYLLKIFDTIIDKMSVFYPFYNNEKKYLVSIRDEFIGATQIEQVNILQQLLIMLHANSSNAKIEFGEIKKSRFGRKSNGVQIKDIDLIYQSVTGLYQSIFHVE